MATCKNVLMTKIPLAMSVVPAISAKAPVRTIILTALNYASQNVLKTKIWQKNDKKLGLDTDHFWPMIRPDLAPKGPRPLAEKEKCPNGCDIAKEVDQFACAYFGRVGELHQLFEEYVIFRKTF